MEIIVLKAMYYDQSNTFQDIHADYYCDNNAYIYGFHQEGFEGYQIGREQFNDINDLLEFDLIIFESWFLQAEDIQELYKRYPNPLTRPICYCIDTRTFEAIDINGSEWGKNHKLILFMEQLDGVTIHNNVSRLFYTPKKEMNIHRTAPLTMRKLWNNARTNNKKKKYLASVLPVRGLRQPFTKMLHYLSKKKQIPYKLRVWGPPSEEVENFFGPEPSCELFYEETHDIYQVWADAYCALDVFLDVEESRNYSPALMGVLGTPCIHTSNVIGNRIFPALTIDPNRGIEHVEALLEQLKDPDFYSETINYALHEARVVTEGGHDWKELIQMTKDRAAARGRT